MAMLSPVEIYARALATQHAVEPAFIDQLLEDVAPRIPPNGVFGYTNSQVIEKMKELFHMELKACKMRPYDNQEPWETGNSVRSGSGLTRVGEPLEDDVVGEGEIESKKWPWDTPGVVLPKYIQPEGWITFFGKLDSKPEGSVAFFGNVSSSAPSVFRSTAELPAFRYSTQYRILLGTQSVLERCFYEYFCRGECGSLDAMSGYWKGQILDAKGWSCPESSELSEYARTLRDGLRWNQLEKTVENLQHVVDDMNNMIELRNVAVHRNYISGLKLRMLLRAAASTVQALGDDGAFDILFKIMGIVWSRQSEIIDGMRRGETAFQEAISRRPVTVTVAGEPLDIWKNIRQAESDACERLEEEIGKLMDDVVPSPLGNERQVDPNSRRLPLQSNYWHRQRIFSPISGPVVGGSGIFKNSDKFLACSDGTNWDGRPRRPVYGTGGVKVWIRTNHFPMRLPNKTIFVYHVTIRPTCSNRRQKMQLYKLLENNPQYPADCAATDYAETIVSMKQLSSSIIVDDNDGHTFNMLKVREIPLGVLREYLEGRISGYNLAPTFQALQIILAKCLKNNQEVLQTYGKGYFLVGGHSDWVKTVGAGSIAMRGFNFSVRPTVGGLLCGVNVCSTRFYKEGPLTDLIAECLMTNDLGEIQHLSSVQIQKLRRYLRTIMVRIVEAAVQENRKGLVHIIGIDARTPTQVVFEYYDPLQGLAREMNMEEYFSNVRNIRLRYPHLPCVLVGQRTVQRPIPVELCRVVGGQPVRGFREFEQAIPHFCSQPAVTAQTVAEFGLYFRGENAHLRNFGINISNRMAIIPARILNTPTVTYKNKTFSPNSGSWNLVGAKLASAGAVTSWTVLIIEDRVAIQKEANFVNAVDNFRVKCAEIGLEIGPYNRDLRGVVRLSEDPESEGLCRVGDKLSKMAGKVTFVLVIFDFHNELKYSSIKLMGDLQYGVLTVCMKWHMMSAGKSQYISNVALKLNLKLGGTNHTIQSDSLGSLRSGRKMIVGCRVSHCNYHSRRYFAAGRVDDLQFQFQSIAGVVASMDGRFNLYPASFRIQSCMEAIQDLKGMMIERLQQWSRTNDGAWPDSVIFYRSGICESQIIHINNIELPQIRQSFKECGAGSTYNPKITIIIVSKNHNTRFYPTSVEHADRTGNVTPGMVEDRVVASPHMFSFFLQSHAAAKGTAKPAYYQVIHDDNKFGANDIQKLTHNLCYLYGRATKSIAVCAPVRYAELMCKRGALYTGADAWAGHEISQVSVHERLKETMFYV